jgi:hypothetical protein
MIIKSKSATVDISRKAKIEMFTGEELSITYKTPDGHCRTVSIMSQHLVLLINHKESRKSMVISSTDTTFVG